VPPDTQARVKGYYEYLVSNFIIIMFTFLRSILDIQSGLYPGKHEII